MTISSVGVLGAGVMGRGVSQVLAQTNHRVVLVDVSEDQLSGAARDIPRGVRLQKLLGKSAAAQSPDDCVRRITHLPADRSAAERGCESGELFAEMRRPN